LSSPPWIFIDANLIYEAFQGKGKDTEAEGEFELPVGKSHLLDRIYIIKPQVLEGELRFSAAWITQESDTAGCPPKNPWTESFYFDEQSPTT
jgi:hypothetical protein